jgi:hypothetical protein
MEKPTDPIVAELLEAARAVLAVLDSRPVDGEIICGHLNMAGVLRRAIERATSGDRS